MQINLFTKQKQTHRQKTNLWLLKGKVGREGGVRGLKGEGMKQLSRKQGE